jgi:hypothetical protein
MMKVLNVGYPDMKAEMDEKFKQRFHMSIDRYVSGEKN